MSYTGTSHCREISVSSSHVPKGYLFSFKRTVSQNWEPAEGKKNYRYNQLSLLQLLTFTRIKKVLNVKGWENPEKQSWGKVFAWASGEMEDFQQSSWNRGAPLDCTPQKQCNPFSSLLLWDLIKEFQLCGKSQTCHRAGDTQRWCAANARDADSMTAAHEAAKRVTHTVCVTWHLCSAVF